MYFKTDLRLAKWVTSAPQNSYEQTYVNSLTIFNGKLYAGTYPSALLFEWNGYDAWVLRADPFGGAVGGEDEINALAVFNNKLYGGSSPSGKLAEWNGSNAWVEKAPQLGSETSIKSMVVFNNKLYAGTYPSGKLFEWNGSNAWVEKAAQLGSEISVRSLVVFNAKLYGVAGGKLYEWNGSNAWVQKAATPGGESDIYALIEFNEKLYGGGYATGKLFEWNGSNAWVEKAAQLGSDGIRSLVVFKDKLLAGTWYYNLYTGYGGRLFEWNGSNAWLAKAPQLNDQVEILSLAAVPDDELYAGTAPQGLLFQLDWDRRKAEKSDTGVKIYVAPPETIWDEATLDLHRISPLSFKLTEYRQEDKIKPRELDLTTDRRTPVSLFSRVLVVEAGKVKFNGFVERITSATLLTRKFVCKGNEAFLAGRYMPKVSYRGGPTIKSTIESMIDYANAYWPPGTPYQIYDESKNIILLKYIDSYVDVTTCTGLSVISDATVKLARRSALSDLQTYDNSYYVDTAKNLYIRVTDSSWYSVGGLLACNAFETFCRIGNVDVYWNRYLRGVLFCDLDEISTLIARVVKRHYYYINLRDDLNYTYLDLSLSAKRSTNAVLREQDILEYSLTSASKPPIQGAIVRGAGYQFASMLDARMGSKYFRLQEYSNTFRRDLGMLKSLASDYFNQQNEGDTIQIKTRPEILRGIRAGDVVSLFLDNEPLKRLQIAKITNSDDVGRVLELGTRIPGLTDMWGEALDVLDDRPLYTILPAFSKSITFKPRDTSHNTCTKGSVTLNFPTGILGPNGKRFLALLDLSLSLQYPEAASDAPWDIKVTVNGKSGDWGHMPAVSLDEGLSEVDITDLIIEGANTIEIIAQYSDNFSNSHGGCNAGEMFPKLDWIVGDEWNGHPDITASVSINFYRMNY
jgi:hypothetical protein